MQESQTSKDLPVTPMTAITISIFGVLGVDSHGDGIEVSSKPMEYSCRGNDPLVLAGFSARWRLEPVKRY